MIERLQVECDKESRRILTEMAQRRNLEHIVRQVRCIVYSILKINVKPKIKNYVRALYIFQSAAFIYHIIYVLVG